MTSFNELAVTFRTIIDDLFNSNGFECRKLFYGKDIYYCGRDILKCLNYNENTKRVANTLNKLRAEDKFSILKIQELYSSPCYK